tara:strand:- start:3195 stop:3431 length:237 start_codon:yes stop_codon:yes gene_type:complete
MENKLVIFPNDDGGISVLHPVMNCGLSVEEIAVKDVPSGKPFKYITTNDLPTDDDGYYDTSFRSAWEADFSSPDGYGA